MAAEEAHPGPPGPPGPPAVVVARATATATAAMGVAAESASAAAATAVPVPLRRYEIALSRVLLLRSPVRPSSSSSSSSSSRGSSSLSSNNTSESSSSSPSLSSSPTTTSASSCRAPRGQVGVQPVFRRLLLLLLPPCCCSGEDADPSAGQQRPPPPPRLDEGPRLADVNVDAGNLHHDDTSDIATEGVASGAATPASGPGHSQDAAKAEAKRLQVESMLACLDHVLEQHHHHHNSQSRRSRSRNDDDEEEEEKEEEETPTNGGDDKAAAPATSSSSSTSTLPAARRSRPRRSQRRLTVVDLGGGSGHLAIEAAIEFQSSVNVVVIDLSRHSLDLMTIKASMAEAEAEAQAVRTRRRQEGGGAAENNDDNQDDADHDDLVASNPFIPLERTAIPNLYALCGPIEHYLFLSRSSDPSEDEGDTDADTDRPRQDDGPALPFDVGLALHLCGQSTDVAIRACLHQGAALVAAPCCVGKTQTTRKNPYVFQATGSNTSSIQYPQSDLYRQLLLWPDSSSGGDANSSGTGENDHDPTSPAPNPSSSSAMLLWDALASAADDSSSSSTTNHRHASATAKDASRPLMVSDAAHRSKCGRRAAKVLVEWDRCLFLQQYGYHTILTRMVPTTASPKHDIIVAIPTSWTRSDGGPGESLHSQFQDVDHEAVVEVEQTRRYLQAATSGTSGVCVPCADTTEPFPSNLGREAVVPTHGAWTESEVAEVHELLAAHFGRHGGAQSNEDCPRTTHRDDVYYFPTGMGRDRRKLIHYVASTLGLEHWSHGKKQGTGKTVAVALPGTRRRLQCCDVRACASSEEAVA